MAEVLAVDAAAARQLFSDAVPLKGNIVGILIVGETSTSPLGNQLHLLERTLLLLADLAVLR